MKALSIEEYKRKLKEEGFKNIYDWKDKPGTGYKPHKHRGKVSFYLIEAAIEMHFENGKKILIKAGERMDVPPGVIHTAIVGKDGC